ncbi:MAG: urease accessory protein UreD [Cyanobacteriota bacterium]|nr:urease accessory protein UreD [Cyanobacteriota bacterium]
MPGPLTPVDVPPFTAAASHHWHGQAKLRFERRHGRTVFQGETSAPLRVQRACHGVDGRCELPLLHTAGGLVGGDQLTLDIQQAEGSAALITSVAAQKVYGTIGRSRRDPGGAWARQTLHVTLERGADLEWLPQELVLYANGLMEQRTRVVLAPEASWLGAEVVRLGRTAAGEGLEAGRWRSGLEICRSPAGGDGARWELIDRWELAGPALVEAHGLAGQAVFGSLAWVGPETLEPAALAALVGHCREAREGLEGEMACGALERGLVARYRGSSTTAARGWFTRIWRAVRAMRQLPPPTLPRVWPFQDAPLAREPGAGAVRLDRDGLDLADPRALRQ